MRRTLIAAAAMGMLVLAGGGVAGAADEPTDITPAASASVVVNEVSVRGPNGMLDEFIEIRNISNNAIELTDYQIKVYDQRNVLVNTIVVPEGIVLQPRGNLGQFLVLTSQNFSGTIVDETYVVPTVASGEGLPNQGGVAIFNPNGAKIDGVAFSSAVTAAREGAAALPETLVSEPLGASSGRDILSTDTDNNRTDFALHQRTPGAIN
ncbi:lamin tail domain-containing protein [Umezawaea sp.]|uniref:lamin tail domain-containing protein n=1 Tax=Umezawaea sp. TaxID=1955258 RepID=UPI002ED06C61